MVVRKERTAHATLLELVGRRVRRLLGCLELPGWCVKVKRVPDCTPADLARWWCEAVELARRAGGVLPLLMVRCDGAADWTCYWPSALHHTEARRDSTRLEDTVAAHPLTWWRCTRHLSCGEVRHGRNEP